MPSEGRKCGSKPQRIRNSSEFLRGKAAWHDIGTEVPPLYCLHKQSGQAVFNWPLGSGKYKSILLGPHGSPESHTEYERILAEWRASHGSLPSSLNTRNGRPADLTLFEIALAFDTHADRYYRNPTTGEPTGEPEDDHGGVD